MLARHYDSMGRTTSMYTHSVGPTRRPRVHRQPNQPTPLNHQDPCTTRPPTHRHLGVHHFGSALPTQRAENGASHPAYPRAAVACRLEMPGDLELVGRCCPPSSSAAAAASASCPISPWAVARACC